MADVIVSKEATDEGAKQLGAILGELTNMRAEWDGGSIWGHDTVKDAMNDFVDSWWVKREKLQSNLEDLQGKMEQSSEAWNEVEDGLTDSITS